MSDLDADRNLLFGFLALQNGLISRENLIAATSLWLQDKSQPLARILVEREFLAEEQRAMLEPLVKLHLDTHQGDPEKSLAAIDVVSSVRDELRQLGDRDIEATVARVMDVREHDDQSSETMAWHPTASECRYQILRPHAKGGLGVVSVALDQELNREVAFKEIQADFAEDEVSRTRFVQEAEITGGLEHPGIVPIYGLGQHKDGRPYYAMRFVKGETLRHAILRFHNSSAELNPTQRALILRKLLAQFVDVCNAIEYAHSRGVLHRDIKPANVMLGKYGETLVVDWGLAKSIDREESQQSADEVTLRPTSGGSSTGTRMGSAIGTPSFMSPEQAAGRLNDLGPSSDVYSLGATLYFILAGQAPLHDTDAITAVRKAQAGEFPRPRSVNPAIPVALEAICLKAMALTPKGRYDSAATLAADVERWLADEPTAAHRESLFEHVGRLGRRHRSWVRAGTAATFMLAIGALVAAGLIEVQRQKADQAAEEANRAGQLAINSAKAANKAKQEALEHAQQTRRSLYTSHMNMAQQASETAFLGPLPELLAPYMPQSGQEDDLRGFEWYYWWRQAHGYRLSVNYEDSFVWAVDIAPAGDSVAAGGSPLLLPWFWGQVPMEETYAVKIWDAETGNLKATSAGHARGVKSIAYSPDGKLFASAGGDSMVKVWDAKSGEIYEEFEHQNPAYPMARFVHGVAFLPDGKRLLSVNNSIIIWDVEEKRQLREFAIGEKFILHMAVSLDGTKVAVIRGGILGQPGILELWSVPAEDGEVREPRTVSVEGHQFIALAHDGKTIATAGINKTISLWDASAPDEIRMMGQPLEGHANVINSIRFTPDGSRLVSGAADGRIIYWDVAAQQQLYTLKGYSQQVHDLALSKDGATLISGAADGTVKLWDAADVQSESAILSQDKSNTVLDYSPDGRLLAAGGGEGAIIVWDAASEEVLAEMDRDNREDRVNDICFLEDGKSLIACGNDGTVQAWEAETGRTIGEFPIPNSDPTRRILCLAASAKSGLLAGLTSDGAIVIWDLKTKQAQVTAMRGSRALGTRPPLEFSPDGKHIVTRGEKSDFTVWDVATSEPLWTQHGGNDRSVYSVAYSPDGTILAVATETGTITLWNTTTHDKLHVMQGASTWIRSLAFSPGDGSRLASGSDDQLITLWDVGTGEPTTTLKGHDAYVLSVAFAPDGNTIASTGDDDTVRLWRAATPQEVSSR